MVILHVHVLCLLQRVHALSISLDVFRSAPLMSSLKRPRTDENTPLVRLETSIKFVDGLKRRRISNKVTDEEIRVLREKRANDDAQKAEEQRRETLAKAKATAEAQSAQEEVLFARVLSCMTDCGFGSLHGYLHRLMTTKAQHASSQASKLLINEGKGLLNDMRNKQPGVVNGWAAAATGEILADEGLKLASYLRPQQGRPLTDAMSEFSLERILADAELLAPTLCSLLRDFATNGAVSPAAERRDNDLVSTHTSLLKYG
jgi:hypothetical protein